MRLVLSYPHREMARVVKKDGRVLLLEHTRSDNGVLAAYQVSRLPTVVLRTKVRTVVSCAGPYRRCSGSHREGLRLESRRGGHVGEGRSAKNRVHQARRRHDCLRRCQARKKKRLKTI